MADQCGLLRHHDHPGIVGQRVQREIHIHRKAQRIGVIPVIRPFLIGAEIGEAGFDLNADEPAIRPQRQNVSAPAIGEPNLVQRHPMERHAEPRGLAADQSGAIIPAQPSSAEMARASVTSFSDNPPASCVVSVISTRFHTLDHSG